MTECAALTWNQTKHNRTCITHSMLMGAAILDGSICMLLCIYHHHHHCTGHIKNSNAKMCQRTSLMMQPKHGIWPNQLEAISSIGYWWGLWPCWSTQCHLPFIIHNFRHGHGHRWCGSPNVTEETKLQTARSAILRALYHRIFNVLSRYVHRFYRQANFFSNASQ